MPDWFSKRYTVRWVAVKWWNGKEEKACGQEHLRTNNDFRTQKQVCSLIIRGTDQLRPLRMLSIIFY